LLKKGGTGQKGEEEMTKKRLNTQQLQVQFTTVPNQYYDEIMPSITNLAALKVYECIMRKTIGWGKSGDWITIKQMTELTHLSRPSVCQGVAWLETRGLIWTLKVGDPGREKKLYFLATDQTEPIEMLVKDGTMSGEAILKMITYETDRRKYRKAVQRGTFLDE